MGFAVSSTKLFGSESNSAAKASYYDQEAQKKKNEHDPQVAYATQMLPSLLSNPSGTQQTTASAFMG